MNSRLTKAAISPLQVSFFLFLVGISASLHIWKLAPALPALQQELQLSLVESGFLLSSVQIGGMTLGLIIGLFAERIGFKRCILIGMFIIVVSSIITTLTPDKTIVLLSRAIEGCGFLMVVLPVPALVKRLVSAQQLSRIMGLWGCYMPTGTVIILLVGSWLLTLGSWRMLWLVLAVVSTIMLVLSWFIIPADSQTTPKSTQPKSTENQLFNMVTTTLRSSKIWLVALVFCVYAAQWAGVIGFLPTIYMAGDISVTSAGLLTAIVAGANVIGNLGAGKLLQKQYQPQHLLWIGFVTMMGCAIVAFGLNVSLAVQFWAIVVFSAVGGLIPATCFYLSVNHAPTPQTTSSSVGWVQQCSSMGQFFGPPAVALAVNVLGGWQWAWVATVTFAVVGMFLAWGISQKIKS